MLQGNATALVIAYCASLLLFCSFSGRPPSLTEMAQSPKKKTAWAGVVQAAKALLRGQRLAPDLAVATTIHVRRHKNSRENLKPHEYWKTPPGSSSKRYRGQYDASCKHTLCHMFNNWMIVDLISTYLLRGASGQYIGIRASPHYWGGTQHFPNSA